MSRAGSIGLGVLFAASVAALAAFLMGGGLGETLLTLAVAAFPAGLYLAASGTGPFRFRQGIVPAVLFLVLSAGLFRIQVLSGRGDGVAGLWVLIGFVGILPLVFLSTLYSMEKDGARIDRSPDDGES